MAQLTDVLGIDETKVQELYKLYRDLTIKSRNTSSMIIAIELIPGLQEREKIFLGYILGRNASQFIEK